MKVKMTLEQLKQVLATEPLKTPIEFKVKNLNKKDMKELVKLLKEKG